MFSPRSSISKRSRCRALCPAVGQGGFTLVEIMVGLIVGLVSTLFITNIFVSSASQRRTTASVDDALINGSLAMHTLEAALKEAGAGVATIDLLGCRLMLDNGLTIDPLAPVHINHPQVPEGDANTDTLLIVSSHDFGAPEGYINGMPATFFQTTDWVIATPPSPCSIAPLKLVLYPNRIMTGMDKIYNLGAAPRFMAYAIRNGNLTRCDLRTGCLNPPTNWQTIANNIVSMKAHYGRDDGASADGIVETYGVAPPTGSSPACTWARVLTLRLALTARGTQYEKTAVPLYDSHVSWAGIDLSKTTQSNPADWQNYHYRFFQVIAPLRSLMSGGIQGC